MARRQTLAAASHELVAKKPSIAKRPSTMPQLIAALRLTGLSRAPTDRLPAACENPIAAHARSELRHGEDASFGSSSARVRGDNITSAPESQTPSPAPPPRSATFPCHAGKLPHLPSAPAGAEESTTSAARSAAEACAAASEVLSFIVPTSPPGSAHRGPALPAPPLTPRRRSCRRNPHMDALQVVAPCKFVAIA